MRLLAAVAVVSLPTACSPGGAANAVRAEAPTAQQAMGEAAAPACTSVPAVAQTLVIDLPSAQRADLELAMKSGRAVVHYGCDGLRVLSSCELKGDYRFAGVSLKQEVVQLKSQDEVRASLPISGATLAGGVARVWRARAAAAGPPAGSAVGSRASGRAVRARVA